MTKQQLQQELKDKVKEGIKPSHLKRSKSLGDIPSASPLPTQPNIQQLEQENKQLKNQLEKANQDWANLATKLLDDLKENTSPLVKQLQKQLDQTVKDATTEITRQENEIKQLKTKLTQTNNQNQDLTSQIKEYQRAAEFRLNNPFPEKAPTYNWWTDYGPVILLLALYGLSYWLLNKNLTNYEEKN